MKNKILVPLVASIASLVLSSNAFSTVFTSTSSSGTDVTTFGASTIGGVVADLEGTNGAHVISQLSASTLFTGYSSSSFVIGTQNGFNSTVTDALGGGLSSVSFRFTLYDGDHASGEFDYQDNILLVNGFNLGNWSYPTTERTDSLGNLISSNPAGGFRNGILDTGWFSSTDNALLSSLFASIVSTESLQFVMNDSDPGDNFLDFTQGIDNSLLNVGQGPVITNPTVPEPGSLALIALGLLGFGAARKGKQA